MVKAFTLECNSEISKGICGEVLGIMCMAAVLHHQTSNGLGDCLRPVLDLCAHRQILANVRSPSIPSNVPHIQNGSFTQHLPTRETQMGSGSSRTAPASQYVKYPAHI